MQFAVAFGIYWWSVKNVRFKANSLFLCAHTLSFSISLSLTLSAEMVFQSKSAPFFKTNDRSAWIKVTEITWPRTRGLWNGAPFLAWFVLAAVGTECVGNINNTHTNTNVLAPFVYGGKRRLCLILFFFSHYITLTLALKLIYLLSFLHIYILLAKFQPGFCTINAGLRLALEYLVCMCWLTGFFYNNLRVCSVINGFLKQK